ncbi:HutD/Ves family protein [Leeia aquatica]|uniref:HutD family protein n=1 Tax=Leeia aquatica TaxID=2725557 RepID=A0A847SHW9_9NEIS|nr:HutD family protein [Leeia aquatica]NLR76918.1 HutD family protein [Leeia aquatica]
MLYWQTIPYHRLTPTPWKNGGGLTREIARFPANSSLDDFEWRISSAEVAASGPFSRFPGVDRHLLLLDGQLQLQEEAGTVLMLSPDHPAHAFAGEASITATLPGGPVRDFNLMLRRGRWHGTLTSEQQTGALVVTGTVLLHATEAPCIVTLPRTHQPMPGTEPPSQTQTVLLHPGDSLLCWSRNDTPTLQLHPAGRLIIAQLHRCGDHDVE